jgi:hypothetical protein
MISKFQFKTVSDAINSGTYDYIQLRQRCGLTSDELNEILDNFEFYENKFSQEADVPKKKPHWWSKRG